MSDHAGSLVYVEVFALPIALEQRIRENFLKTSESRVAVLAIDDDVDSQLARIDHQDIDTRVR